ncbi:hypothetical protein [Winogradskyella marincola]|uniref:Anti-sigma factor n=1 Tax=Winogradskyella marincola TaxID=3037795 RepID=A0ABT6FX99_9FLAO|nr:hypothetical protein [Winogradskyella sp. YYF002]MDG4714412.1 hypothetical protein [Winogradskyella sp. YYF002]
MKQDIRDLFKEEEDLKTLPDNHRAEFLDKLNQQKQSKNKRYTWIGAVAVVVVALTIGFALFPKQPTENISPFIAQVEAVEAEYLEEIKTEWQSFVALADDEVLVARFKKKLDELDNDYKIISKQFKSDANNIQVVEALVENLQTRLQILKDIQEHIKILNQKNEQNEKSI